MTEERFRIKEVVLPIQFGKLSVFYPQVLRIETKTTGYLWWKKTVAEKYWEALHKFQDNGKVMYYTKKYDFNEVICCDTKEQAEHVINEYKKDCINHMRDWYKKNANTFTDETMVRHHEV
jgi:hypothetical protein